MQAESQLFFSDPPQRQSLAKRDNLYKISYMIHDDAIEQTRSTPGPSRMRLAQEIRQFLNETGMFPTPFGILAAKDDKLLWRIENAPKGISLDKADRIREFMAESRRTRNYRPASSPKRAIVMADPIANVTRKRKRSA